MKYKIEYDPHPYCLSATPLLASWLAFYIWSLHRRCLQKTLPVLWVVEGQNPEIINQFVHMGKFSKSLPKQLIGIWNWHRQIFSVSKDIAGQKGMSLIPKTFTFTVPLRYHCIAIIEWKWTKFMSFWKIFQCSFRWD